MSLKHWFSTDARNPCPKASDPASTGSHQERYVTCPLCRAAIRAFEFGAEETVKSFPAIERKAATP